MCSCCMMQRLELHFGMKKAAGQAGVCLEAGAPPDAPAYVRAQCHSEWHSFVVMLGGQPLLDGTAWPVMWWDGALRPP